MLFQVSTPPETPFSTNILLPSMPYISCWISSSAAAFPDFIPHMVAATLVNVKTSSFPKSIVSHALVGVALTEFNKSSKYAIHREGISFFPLGCSQLNPWWRLWYLNFFLASDEWSARELCLPINSWNLIDYQTPPKSILWTFYAASAAAFCAWNTGIANQIMTGFVTRP